MHQAQAITLNLPFPPAANNLFFNAGKKGRVKSPRYTAWLKEAGYIAKTQAKGSVNGLYRLIVLAGKPDKRARDLDNIIKPISDLLVSLGIVSDDSLCRRLEAEWRDDIEGVRVVVVGAGEAGAQPLQEGMQP